MLHLEKLRRETTGVKNRLVNLRSIIRSQDVERGRLVFPARASMEAESIAEQSKALAHRSDAAFERYMDELFDTIAPGDAFVLGVADNIMPGAKIERLRRVAEMVEERGRYPIA